MAKVSKLILQGRFDLNTSVNGKPRTYFVHVEPNSVPANSPEFDAWALAINTTIRDIVASKTVVKRSSPATDRSYFPPEGWCGPLRYTLDLILVIGTEKLETTMYVEPIPVFAGVGVSF